MQGKRSFVSGQDRTAAYGSTVQALEELLRAQGLDVVERAVAEALWLSLRSEFAQRHDLRPGSGHACARMLTEGARHGGYCLGDPVREHCEIFMQGVDAKLYVAQPYGPLRGGKLRDLLAFSDENGLDVSVAAGSWHFPGRTLMVAFRKSPDRNTMPPHTQRYLAPRSLH